MLRNGALNKPARLHIFVLPRDLLKNSLLGVFIRPSPASLASPPESDCACHEHEPL